MVVDVQKSNLAEFFPQYEENCVQVLDAFRDEIPPQCSSHLSQTGHEKWVEAGTVRGGKPITVRDKRQ